MDETHIKVGGQWKHLCRAVDREGNTVASCSPASATRQQRSAQIIIAGIETMHMNHKEQLDCPEGKALSAANQFYSLAA